MSMSSGAHESIEGMTDSDLSECGEFFADKLSGAISRHRWLVEQTIGLASALVIRRGVPLDDALAQARDAVLATLSDAELLRSSTEPPEHSAVARHLLPRLRGSMP